MKRLNFTKMVASGNDFVVLENRGSSIQNLSIISRKVCDRKYGVGADGLLVLEKSKIADVRMRIFNADGSEAEMCGNGARCAALYACLSTKQNKCTLETKAGIIDCEVRGDTVKIKLTNPEDIKLDIPVNINGRNIKTNFINTGVPHAVIPVEGLDKMDIVPLGRAIRYHKVFSPAGTNVDFIEVLGKNSIEVRTYERGVEDETLACGTGSVASALIFALKTGASNKIRVGTRGKEELNVYFDRINGKFNNVWLQGPAKKVYEGVYNV